MESISTDTESVGVESAISELRNAIMENKLQYKIAYSAFCVCVWKCNAVSYMALGEERKKERNNRVCFLCVIRVCLLLKCCCW